ncbi:hypothetical protein [Mitsuaria sp. 7]|uniref:hypothetical protein n=1 Tax=Mitsuaria sp. 7 TaxID=1658665 RepID=UPI0012F82244|nr:hypothetical protein [Mitsuaria sp. 7]
MKPWEIAARVCRPMSTEEALRLSAEKHGFREFGDIDPEIEALFRETIEEVEREKADAARKDPTR